MNTTAQAPARAPQALPVRIAEKPGEGMGVGAWIALGGILAVAWMLRARNFHFSTAYMDEALYIEYGRMFLARSYQWPLDHPLRWTWGWYLWPAMAAMADRVGGLAGVRALAAVLGLVTVTSVWGFARRLFTPAVGLASAMVFAVLAPAVFSARIATRDCASIPFFALGLWAYAAAWQDNKKRFWLAAGAGFLAAFLCKYVVAIFFPALVLLALKKGWKPILLFCAPLTIACGFYLFFYRGELVRLLEYGRQYHQLAIKDSLLIWENYFSKRADFWIIAGLSVLAFPLLEKKDRWKGAWLFLAGCLFLAFQWRTRADRDYWKHATYPLLFLTPLAMAGVIGIARKSRVFAHQITAFFMVLAVSVTVGYLGSAWSMEETQDWANRAVWPDADPILTYLDGRLSEPSRVLADDSIFGYYLQPPLEHSHTIDPFFFKYNDTVGDSAYTAAVHDGYFDFVVFDSGVGEEAQHMHALLAQVLPERYQLRLQVADAVLGHPVQVYERVEPPVQPVAAGGPSLQIVSPKTGEAAPAQQPSVIQGTVAGAAAGAYVHVDVYTNRWYPQGEKIAVAPDGTFSAKIFLGGQGPEQCHHMVRAQLFNADGRRMASTASFEIQRLEADGSQPKCK